MSDYRRQEIDGVVVALGEICVSCGRPIKGAARALITRVPMQYPETADRVWLLSRNVPAVFEKLCRAKRCVEFLRAPALPAGPEGVVFEDSIFHRKTARFVDGPVLERPWLIRPQFFFRTLAVRR